MNSAAVFVFDVLAIFVCLRLARVRGRNTWIAVAVAAIFGLAGLLGYALIVLWLPPRNPPFVDPLQVWLDKKWKLKPPDGYLPPEDRDDYDDTPGRPDL